MIAGDDFLKYAQDWDARIAAAFPLMVEVAQPLWELVGEKAGITARQAAV